MKLSHFQKFLATGPLPLETRFREAAFGTQNLEGPELFLARAMFRSGILGYYTGLVGANYVLYKSDPFKGYHPLLSSAVTVIQLLASPMVQLGMAAGIVGTCTAIGTTAPVVLPLVAAYKTASLGGRMLASTPTPTYTE